MHRLAKSEYSAVLHVYIGHKLMKQLFIHNIFKPLYESYLSL
jgi:hypothetical protein